ncbi:MAG: PAS domain S-box protein [Methylocystaceae bacterium]|nr:PAS domain S-box protein [Methylocystaceae bacterium]
MGRFVVCLCLIFFSSFSVQADLPFEDYFEKNVDVMMLIDPEDGQIIDANKAAHVFYGYSDGELEKLKIQQINQFTPEQITQEIALAKKQERNFFVFRHKIADGTTKTVEVRTQPIDYEGRKLILSVVRNISEKRALQGVLWHYQNRLEEMVKLQADELNAQNQIIVGILILGLLITFGLLTALYVSKIRLMKASDIMEAERNSFANIIEGTRVGTWEWNIQTGETHFNEKWADIIGYSLAELEPVSIETWMKYTHPEDLKKSEKALQKCFSKEADHYDVTCRMQHKDGHWVWVQDRGKIFSWTDDDQPLIMAGTHTNVTEQVLAEEKFRNLLEHAADGIHILDTNGDVIMCNQAFADTLGYTLEEAQKLNVTDWDSVVEVDEIESLFTTLINQGERFETKHRRKDGSIIDVQINAKGIDLNGEQYLYASQREITELKELQYQLEEQVELSKAASRAKSSFLANMSHEIRTPMSGIKGIVELLLSSKGLNEYQRDLLYDLDTSSDALLTLLNDILDFSKIEAEKLEIIPSLISLDGTLHSVTKLFAPAAAKKGLNITFEADGVKGIYALVDGLRLRQIVSNLMGNAVKFTQKGHIRLNASLEKADVGAVLHVSVEDTGIGLEPEETNDIFNPFSQISAKKNKDNKSSGTGLGLAISSQLVRMMGGNISVESELGKGSVFKIDVPVTLADAPVCRATNIRDTLPLLKILFAEDNAINQKVIGKMLEQHGHQVTIANNGDEAINVFSENDFDLILMDMQMPVMDGEEAMTHIRLMGGPKSQIPIIAFTADAIKEHREDYLLAGADDVLIKPVKWETLEAKLFKVYNMMT